MKIQRENLALISSRPVGAQINHEPAVGVATAEDVRPGARLSRILPALPAVPMKMICGLLHHSVTVRRQMLAVHPFVIRPRYAVPKMTDDRVNEKQLAILVPIVTPW